MIFLDTNVLCEAMRPAPDPNVIAWLDSHEPGALLLTAITVAEILDGINRLPDGRRKADLLRLSTSMFEDDFAQRIVSFDATAAAHYADLVCQRERQGRPMGMADAQIASICRSVGGAMLATRNVRDFSGTGLAIVNPWDAA